MSTKSYQFYLKKFEKGKRNIKPEMIKYLLLDLQHKDGAVINPIIISHAIYKYLQENNFDKNGKPCKNNREYARTYAYLYACLCNEYRIQATTKKVVDFFITKEKWEHYMIGGTVIKKGIVHLKNMGLISFENDLIRPFPIFKPRMFNINLNALYDLRAKETNANKTTDNLNLEYNVDELDNIKNTVQQKSGRLNKRGNYWYYKPNDLSDNEEDEVLIEDSDMWAEERLDLQKENILLYEELERLRKKINQNTKNDEEIW